jgi:hypothetical protein
MCAEDLHNMPHGKKATVAGCGILQPRPGTAEGLVFIRLEDETRT